jgi:hypothetical protein
MEEKKYILPTISIYNTEESPFNVFPHYFTHIWSTVFLEKPTVTQLVKKLPAIHGTQRYIKTVTRACQV